METSFYVDTDAREVIFTRIVPTIILPAGPFMILIATLAIFQKSGFFALRGGVLPFRHHAPAESNSPGSITVFIVLP